MSTIRVCFHASTGNFTLNVDATFPNKGVTGIFGPSGAGKTTLVRCIAGLMRADEGYCSVGDTVWQDDAQHIFLPVHLRGVGYVFQEPSLFPHLSVRRNIAYGQRRVPQSDQLLQLDQVVEWTGIDKLLDRMPHGLSGGERQRVAIARALLASPRLLLLDEPLASLDEPSRAELIPCLDRLHRDLAIPMLLVSHSMRELARIADTLILLRNGRVEKNGPVHDVIAHLWMTAGTSPDDLPFAVIDAPVAEHDDAYALSALQTPFGLLWTSRVTAAVGDTVRVQIAARDVSIGRNREEHSSFLNQLEARIASMSELSPGQVLLELTPAMHSTATILSIITRRSWDHLHLAVGDAVFARVKGVSILR